MEPNFGKEETAGDKFKSGFLELIEFIAIVAVIVLGVHYFVAVPHEVSGNSMLPNFHNGEFIITNKLALRFGELKRGEVIVFQSPREENKVFIKRILGLPGEKVKLSGGRFYINGQLLEEPYLPQGLLTIPEAFLSEGEEIVVPDGQYFVAGDNRPASSDSRDFGPIKKEAIIGKALLRYWPVSQAGLIKHGS